MDAKADADSHNSQVLTLSNKKIFAHKCGSRTTPAFYLIISHNTLSNHKEFTLKVVHFWPLALNFHVPHF